VVQENLRCVRLGLTAVKEIPREIIVTEPAKAPAELVASN
jgi:hypothetical protein